MPASWTTLRGATADNVDDGEGGADEVIPSDLCVTATGASNTQVTATLPNVTGEFHYITHIRIDLFSVANRPGSVTPNLVTSTNLPGSLVWNFPTAGNYGGLDTKSDEPVTPLKSSVANTDTTIVGPATISALWRITVYYYTAP